MSCFIIWYKGKSPKRGYLIIDELSIPELNENMLFYITISWGRHYYFLLKNLSSSIYTEYMGSEIIQKNKALLFWGPCASSWVGY